MSIFDLNVDLSSNNNVANNTNDNNIMNNATKPIGNSEKSGIIEVEGSAGGTMNKDGTISGGITNIDAYTLSIILKGRKDYKMFLSDCKEKILPHI